MFFVNPHPNTKRSDEARRRNGSPMTRILYFGMLAERTGTAQETLDAMPATVTALRAELLRRHPSLQGLSFRFAVDQQLAGDNTPIAPGAEVALLPPFAGG